MITSGKGSVAFKIVAFSVVREAASESVRVISIHALEFFELSLLIFLDQMRNFSETTLTLDDFLLT